MLSMYIVRQRKPTIQLGWETIFDHFLSIFSRFTYLAVEIPSMSQPNRIEWLKNNKIQLQEHWQHFYCLMSHSVRGLITNPGREKLQLGVNFFNSRHNQSSFHYGDLLVFFVLFYFLSNGESRVESHKATHKSITQPKLLLGVTIDFHKRPHSPRSVNQKALYHNFLSHIQIHSGENKNNRLELNDTQSDYSDWLSCAGRNFWRCCSVRLERDIDVVSIDRRKLFFFSIAELGGKRRKQRNTVNLQIFSADCEA